MTARDPKALYLTKNDFKLIGSLNLIRICSFQIINPLRTNFFICIQGIIFFFFSIIPSYNKIKILAKSL